MQRFKTRKEPGALYSQTMYKSNYDNHAEWKDFLKGMNSGLAVWIDKDMYYYWLECIPPIYMGSGWQFGFCEGSGNVIDFWKFEDKFYCIKSDCIVNH